MVKKRFYLKPFSQSESGLSVCADLEISDGRLLIEYSAIGPIERIRLPDRSQSPARRDGLWEHTCLEFFVAEKDVKDYWEFNFSPSLDWQSYKFIDYRSRCGDETGVVVDLERYDSRTHIELRAQVSGLPLFKHPKRMIGGFAMVVEFCDRKKEYWATEHVADHPDFHSRKSFIALNTK